MFLKIFLDVPILSYAPYIPLDRCLGSSAGVAHNNHAKFRANSGFYDLPCKMVSSGPLMTVGLLTSCRNWGANISSPNLQGSLTNMVLAPAGPEIQYNTTMGPKLKIQY